MKTIKDLTTLKAMTEALGDYLLSNVEFWPLSGRSDYPKLSLGTYLLVRQRLTVAPERQEEIAALAAAGEATLEHWQSTAERKAARELPTRLNLWRRFLEEGHGRYATEVAQRVMAELLVRRFPGLAAAEALGPLDARLRAERPASAFVWDSELQGAFPEAVFWFLYRAAGQHGTAPAARSGS